MPAPRKQLVSLVDTTWYHAAYAVLGFAEETHTMDKTTAIVANGVPIA
jgi:hypothetical protein